MTDGLNRILNTNIWYIYVYMYVYVLRVEFSKNNDVLNFEKYRLKFNISKYIY